MQKNQKILKLTEDEKDKLAELFYGSDQYNFVGKLMDQLIEPHETTLINSHASVADPASQNRLLHDKITIQGMRKLQKEFLQLKERLKKED